MTKFSAVGARGWNPRIRNFHQYNFTSGSSQLYQFWQRLWEDCFNLHMRQVKVSEVSNKFIYFLGLPMRPAAKLRLSRLRRSKGTPLRWTQSGMEVGMDSEAGAELLEHHWETWNIDVPTYHILFSRTLDLMYSLGIRTRMERSFRLFLISSLAPFPHMKLSTLWIAWYEGIFAKKCPWMKSLCISAPLWNTSSGIVTWGIHASE